MSERGRKGKVERKRQGIVPPRAPIRNMREFRDRYFPHEKDMTSEEQGRHLARQVIEGDSDDDAE